MGATSMNLPAIYLPPADAQQPLARPDARLGLRHWKYWDQLRAGRITERDWNDIEDTIARSPGTCMTMGTAATMMSLAEALASRCPAIPRSRRRTPTTRAWPRSPASASWRWCGRT